MTDHATQGDEPRKSGGLESPVAVETVGSPVVDDDEAAAPKKAAHGAANAALVDREVAEYTSGPPVYIDEKTNARLKKMVDRRILVIMIVTYFLQAVDKGALGFASIMGLREDTNLQGQEFSWLTTIIYLVILVVEYPENWILQRVPIAKWLSINVTLWGVTVALTAACSNFTGLVTVRAFLGAFEAVCQPTFTLLSSMWYKREEQGATVVLWYMMNGLQQIIGGLVAFLFTLMPPDSPIHQWQALFMFHGIIAFCWGIFVWFWMPDSPMKAKCWSEEDKKLIVERLRENRTGVQNRVFRPEQVREAFLDPQVWAFILIQLTTTLPSGGVGAYAAIVIQSFGYSTWQVQLLQMVTGVIQVIAMLSAVGLERRFGQTIWPGAAAVLPTIAGAAVLCAVPFEPGRRTGLLLAWYAMYSFWAAVGLALSLVSRNTAGQTKKSVVIALTFVAWAAGNAIGPQIFRKQDAPRYFPAFAVILACFVLLVLILLALRAYYVWQNRQKEAMIARGEAEADVDGVHAFEDITDRKNVNFRYVY